MYKAAILYFICYVKMAANWFLPLSNLHYCRRPSAKENRIYIRVEVTGKKCKTAILLYCFHTAGVLYIIALYNLLGPGTSFYRKSKIIVKRKPNYKIGWFHN